MTNAEKIQSLSVEELAEFLNDVGYGKPPWEEAFAHICKDCPTTECYIDGREKPLMLTECDFADGQCSHGSAALWWLTQEAKEGG